MEGFVELARRQAQVEEWSRKRLLDYEDEFDRASGCDYLRTYIVNGVRFRAHPYDGLMNDELWTKIILGVQAQGGA